MSTHLDPRRSEPRRAGPGALPAARARAAQSSRVGGDRRGARAAARRRGGCPVALVALGGVPGLPTSLPTREQLTGTLGHGAAPERARVGRLAGVAAVHGLRARRAALGACAASACPRACRWRDRASVSPGPSSRAVLLLVTAAGQAIGGRDADVPSRTSRRRRRSRRPPSPARWRRARGRQRRSPAEAARPTPPATYQLGGIELSPEEGAELVGKRVYVVHPPEGRYHDNLWDIAERTMGDGRRYQEIFELNKARDQPDGQELSLARLIYPNWLLVMPEDAVGRGPGRRGRCARARRRPGRPAPAVATADSSAAAARRPRRRPQPAATTAHAQRRRRR